MRRKNFTAEIEESSRGIQMHAGEAGTCAERVTGHGIVWYDTCALPLSWLPAIHGPTCGAHFGSHYDNVIHQQLLDSVCVSYRSLVHRCVCWVPIGADIRMMYGNLSLLRPLRISLMWHASLYIIAIMHAFSLQTRCLQTRCMLMLYMTGQTHLLDSMIVLLLYTRADLASIFLSSQWNVAYLPAGGLSVNNAWQSVL